MNKKIRKQALLKVEAEAKLNKIAQEAIEKANQIGTDDADQFAHNVFLALLQDIKIEGLDS